MLPLQFSLLVQYVELMWLYSGDFMNVDDLFNQEGLKKLLNPENMESPFSPHVTSGTKGTEMTGSPAEFQNNPAMTNKFSDLSFLGGKYDFPRQSTINDPKNLDFENHLNSFAQDFSKGQSMDHKDPIDNIPMNYPDDGEIFNFMSKIGTNPVYSKYFFGKLAHYFFQNKELFDTFARECIAYQIYKSYKNVDPSQFFAAMNNMK